MFDLPVECLAKYKNYKMLHKFPCSLIHNMSLFIFYILFYSFQMLDVEEYNKSMEGINEKASVISSMAMNKSC